MELIPVCGDFHGLLIADGATQDFLGERVFEEPFDRAAHRPGAIHGIEAFSDEEIEGGFGEMEVDLTLLVERAEVHAADSGTVPDYTPLSALPRLTAPTVRQLSVTVTAAPTATALTIGWQAHADALRYIAQVSPDGVSWASTETHVPSTRISEFQPPRALADSPPKLSPSSVL